MMTATPPVPECSRPVRLDTIGTASRRITISADPDERVALARRFGLIALDRLEATFDLVRDGPRILLKGTFAADLAQPCVASGEPVAAKLSEPMVLAFVPEERLFSPAEEVELAADDCDMIAHDGRVVDAGEAVAQSLGLALDPYPRSPRAEAILRAAGVKNEEEAGPLGALADLAERMKAGK